MLFSVLLVSMLSLFVVPVLHVHIAIFAVPVYVLRVSCHQSVSMFFMFSKSPYHYLYPYTISAYHICFCNSPYSACSRVYQFMHLLFFQFFFVLFLVYFVLCFLVCLLNRSSFLTATFFKKNLPTVSTTVQLLSIARLDPGFPLMLIRPHWHGAARCTCVSFATWPH